MKLSGTFTYHACERRQGVKDPTKFYDEVSFLDGMQQLRCSVEKNLFEKTLPGLTPLTLCNCMFEFNPTYSSLRLIDIRPAK